MRRVIVIVLSLAATVYGSELVGLSLRDVIIRYKLKACR